MKLNKEYFKQILDLYDIGELINSKRTEKGSSNYSWIIKTTRGKYILRMLENKKKAENLLFEIEYLESLKKNNFPYEMPCPVLSKKGLQISSFKTYYFLIYRFIEGNTKGRLSKKQIKDVAKMMAILHNISRKIKISAKKDPPEGFKIKEHLDAIKRIEGEISIKNKLNYIDKYYIKNLPIVRSILKSQKINIPKNWKKIPIHSDLSRDNLIFKKDRLKGVIDFDDSRLEYLVKDLARFIASDCTRKGIEIDFSKAKYFLHEYQKIRKLRKSEKVLIPLSIIISSVDSFCWGYYLLTHAKGINMSLDKVDKKLKRILWFDKNKELFKSI